MISKESGEYSELISQIDGNLKSGNIIISGLPQHGKSRFAAWLINEINLSTPNANIIISDEAQSLQYVLGKDFKTFIATENDNDTITLLKEKRCIIDTSLISPENSSELIKDILIKKYQISKIEKSNNPTHVCHPFISVIDEAGDVWDSYSLRSNKTPFKKIFSQAGNYNMHFIFTTNRLASLSTEIVERCQAYIFFKMIADNDIKKLGNILKGLNKLDREKIIRTIKQLDKRKAVYFDGVHAIGFDVPNFNLGEATIIIDKPTKHQYNIIQNPFDLKEEKLSFITQEKNITHKKTSHTSFLTSHEYIKDNGKPSTKEGTI